MNKGKKKSRIGIITLILCLVITMMPFSVWAEGGSEKVTSVSAYASHNAIELEWPSAGVGVKYNVYEGNNCIANETTSTSLVISVNDENPHRYKVYTVVDGVESSQFVESAAKTKVLGIKYNCVIKKKLTLKCKCHGKTTTLPAGKSFTAYEFSVGCYRAEINGHRYAFKRIRLKSGINANGHYDSAHPYSAEEMTRYVNKRGLTSKTNRMVVVSTRGQHLYLFKRSGGKWVIDDHWIVSTGSPKTPTPSGLTTIKRKWLKHNGQRFWSATPTFSFHSKAKSWVLGKPKSGGCIRNQLWQAKYIYYKYKVKTRVCVI